MKGFFAYLIWIRFLLHTYVLLFLHLARYADCGLFINKLDVLRAQFNISSLHDRGVTDVKLITNRVQNRRVCEGLRTVTIVSKLKLYQSNGTGQSAKA